MGSFESWQSVVSRTNEATVNGSQATYPLLGSENDESGVENPRFWSIRVVLKYDYDGVRRSALEESVAEVLVMSGPGDGEPTERCPSCLDVLLGHEGRVKVNLEILRNVTEIKRLQAAYPSVERWVLVSDEVTGDDPEMLVGETIRQLTGVLAGCDVLEIQQGDDESFESLWCRLSVARLMATESELQHLPDSLLGAGFFSTLQERLS
jgi:hypothetical protein